MSGNKKSKQTKPQKTKGIFDKPLKEYSSNPLVPLLIVGLLIIGIAVVGYILLRILVESLLAFGILIVAALGAYWIYDTWLK